ncbi:hypothetical protein BN1182_AM_00720 [Pantoea ananatis]|nr:hypothetical protein BN1182_AM_00720 [Pantoea ananatis]
MINYAALEQTDPQDSVSIQPVMIKINRVGLEQSAASIETAY